MREAAGEAWYKDSLGRILGVWWRGGRGGRGLVAGTALRLRFAGWW